jgi:hypothetical protein
MIRTGSPQDSDRSFFYGNQDQENRAGNSLIKVVVLVVASLLVIGFCVLLFQIFTNQDLHDVKLPWEETYIKDLDTLE